MTDNIQPLTDNDLGEVSGGASVVTDLGGDCTLTETYYCPNCRKELEVVKIEKTSVGYSGIGMSMPVTYTQTKVRCSTCNKDWDPDDLKGSPSTYWHLITKSF